MPLWLACWLFTAVAWQSASAAPSGNGYTLTNAFPGLTFNLPIGFATPPGETNRLFVIEKGGDIAVITNLAAPTYTKFLDLSSYPLMYQDVWGQGGVLGLAFHPGYATNGYFYIFYCASNTTSQGAGLHDILSRFQVSVTNANFAATNSEQILIKQYDRLPDHNAGDVHFGADGYLYVSLGDEGWDNIATDGDLYRNGENITNNFFAGVLRIDVDNRPGNPAPNPHPAIVLSNSTAFYSIPADNPYVNATTLNGQLLVPGTVRTEFYAVGLRNPFRFSIDTNGAIYCGDVGFYDREKVVHIVNGGNYGWSYMEGTTNGPYFADAPPGFVTNYNLPLFEYGHLTNSQFTPFGDPDYRGDCVIGGLVYHGSSIPQLDGCYLYADFNYTPDYIAAFKTDGTNISGLQQLTTGVNIVAFGADPRNGDVLLADHNDNLIDRLVYTNTPRTLFWNATNNVSLDTNWTASANWSPTNGAPIFTDTVLFGPAINGAPVPDNIVDVDFTISTLIYTNSGSRKWHVTTIPDGSTLDVTNMLSVQSSYTTINVNPGGTLIIGAGGCAFGVSSIANLNIGGTFICSNTMVVPSVSGETMAITNGTLDMVNGTVGTTSGSLGELILTNATIRLNLDGANSGTNLALNILIGGTNNTIVIDSITNVSGFTTNHLIQYRELFGSLSGLALGSLPAGYYGRLVMNPAFNVVDLMLAPAAAVTPQFGSFAQTGTNFVFGGSHGFPNGNYYVLASTNISTPLPSWQRLSTNPFDLNGGFNFTNSPGTNLQQFYLLQLQ